jgi:hypothetical protein
VLTLLTLLLCAIPARGAIQPGEVGLNTDRVREHLDRIASHPTRLVGSPGYQATLTHLRETLSGLSGVEVREHTYRLLVPTTTEASLEMEGRRVEAFPFWPAKVRLNATGEDGISGTFVYCGRGRAMEVPPRSAYGNIAVIEANAGQDWQRPFFMGAAAVVVLGSDDVNWQELRHHEIRVPAHLPRVYLPDGPLADRLRRGELDGTPVTLRVVADWVEQEATNLYAFVPGTGGPAPALTFATRFDTAGLVPDLSPGATDAAGLATALTLLERLSQVPSARPVLFTFQGADAINMRGTREMLHALAGVPEEHREVVADLQERLASDRADLEQLVAVGTDPARLDKVADRELLNRVLKVADAEAAEVQAKLFRLRIRDEATLSESELERKRVLSDQMAALGAVRGTMRSDPPALSDDEAMHRDARIFAGRLRSRLAGIDGKLGLIAQLEQQIADRERRIELYAWLTGLTGTPAEPDSRTSQGRPIDTLLGFDLSDGGLTLGPIGWGGFAGTGNNALIQSLRDWFSIARREAEGDGSHWYARANGRLDFDTFIRAQEKVLAPIATTAELAAGWGVPGLTLATLHDLRPRRDTPIDTLDRLDPDLLLAQVESAAAVALRAVDDPDFASGGAYVRRNHRVTGQVLGLAPGRPVPDLPLDGFLAVMYHGRERKPTLNFEWRVEWTLGVRRTEIRRTDAAGHYEFDALHTLGNRNLRFRVIQVYRVEPGSGEVVACSDNGRIGSDFGAEVDLNNGTIRPRKSQVFECEEFALAGLFDPRFLQDLGSVLPRDARRNAEPQRYHFLLRDRILAGFLEPGTRNYFLFRYGQIGNRLALLNVPAPDEPAEASRLARGFSVQELRDLGPLSLQSASDFWNLDSRRLRSYAQAGVSSPLLDELHEAAGEGIADARLAMQADDAAAFERSATGAWATEALVYSAAQAMANDVVRAAIFLLVLCVPFAFCLERLIIATANVYRQIIGALLIFAGMTGALYAFHPAFRISNSALIIILAFAILFMSGLVIWVIYSRFDTELKKVRRGGAGGVDAESATSNSFARASVIGQAVMLGVANMRRRRFRTFLTASTIVLITFAVLAFTSSTTYTSVTSLPTGEQADYPGLMMRQRGYRVVPEKLLPGLEVVGEVAFPNRTIVPRYWNLQNGNEQYAINLSRLREDGTVVQALQSAALGISPGEGQLTPLAAVMGPQAAKRLQDPSQNVVAISEPVAEELGVRVGQTVRAAGYELEVVSIFNPDTYDTRMIALSGEAVAPLEISSDMLDAGGRRLTDTNDQTLSLGGDASAAEVGADYRQLSSVAFFVVPAEVSRRLPDHGLRSVSIRFRSEGELETAVDELTRRYALATFAGYEDGVKLVAATQPTSVAGTAVVVPLLIGGLIIFNTMMGSIAERRREIHVYTSLGLAPMHVGALFVAEALTYGLIGAVFGYVVGQLVGTTLLQFGLLGDATLNYSGTSAMLTMGLILVVVLLSALVPARVASKIAAPSIDRSWRVPAPEDGVIRARLPFTINQTAAAGALAFLADHFDAHRDGTIGKFSADDIESFSQVRDGQRVNGLRASIWLTPFDLGVRQTCEVIIAPGEIEDVYEVDVMLTHGSGGEDAWYRMNRPFLTALRQQFLAWRTLSPQRMLEYVKRSEGMFEHEVRSEKSDLSPKPGPEGGG